MRSRSRRELEQRLERAGFEQEEIGEVLVRLERVGLVDDESFARQVAAHQFRVRRAGARSVAGALMAKGVSRETVEAVLAEAPEAEEARAESLALSRVHRMAGIDPQKAFSRLSSLLIRRGYGPELARRAAREALDLQGPDE